MPRTRGIYKLPSGSCLVKTTIDGQRYNLGTYKEESDADYVLSEFKRYAPSILMNSGHAELKRLSLEAKQQAANKRKVAPSAPKTRNTEIEAIRALKLRDDELQQQIDKLYMQVKLLQGLTQ